MKVILLEDVDNLGSMGDTIEVKKGFARNFLIPQKLAVAATSKNLRAQEHHVKIIEGKKAKAVSDAQSLAEKIGSASLTFSRKAGETGRLFGSVTNMDIAEALDQNDIQVDRREILLEEAIKELGEFEVPVKVHRDVSAVLKVIVVKEEEEE
ncbi:MAG: 50S ribosomal protein L9 [bacterium]|nr:MAG: 50S ribosomal protein L9 [bacterium]